jgi:hypothetical protein
MSRFYGTLAGDASKVQATKRGHRTVTGEARGRDLGLKVEAYAVNDGLDGFQVYITGGSNGKHADIWLATVQESPDGTGFDVHIGERFGNPAKALH